MRGNCELLRFRKIPPTEAKI